MKPSLQLVAETAGVSLSTASLVLGGKGRISAATRQAVLDAATQIGYQTPRARRQPTDRAATANVAVLLNVDHEWAFIWGFIQPVIFEIERVLRRDGVTTLLIPITNDMSNDTIATKIAAAGSAAVVVVHYGNEALFVMLEKSGTPVVLVMNNNFQDRFYSVCVDDFQGAYEGARHVLQLGHRCLAYVDTPRPNLPQLRVDRFIGFKKALDEFTIAFDPQMRLEYNPAQEQAFVVALDRLVHGPQSVSAIFCLDDELAAHVITELRKIGIAVPAQVSIVAPGDVLDYSLPYIPQITTMRINTTLMGRTTANMVFSRIRHTEDEIHVLKIKQQLVSRGSCVAIGDSPGEPG